MEKIWLKSYPEGIPAEIDPQAYRNLGALFEQSVQRFSGLPAYTNLGRTITYGELERLSRAFGAYLRTTLGLAEGDRVALMMPNVLAYPVALFGALRSGLVVVNTNPLYTPRELEHQLADSGARAIVVLENFAHTLAEVRDRVPVEHVVVGRLGDLLGFPRGTLVNFVVRHVKRMVPAFELPGAVPFEQALRAGARASFERADPDPESLAFLQYTGGTTGLSKGAMLTHRNIVANLEQASAWLKPYLEEGREAIVTALPLYHIFSLTANCLTFMKIGGENILVTNPRDLPTFVKILASHRFTVITGVNTLFNALLATPGFRDLDFSSLKLALGGGMAVQQDVARRWKEVTGVPIIEAYGLTETSPAVCINPLDLEEWNGSIGLPVPSTEISIRDEEGRELPVGEVGELWVRGPQVMKGYWNRPEETAEVLDDEGWLRTGDIAVVDENGFVRIVDRKKDMILVSGFNVYPNEVEDVIARHPGVLEVGVIGVPDERSGEAVKAVVVRSDPALTEQSVVEHCRESLAAYKVPSHVEFRDELPKTNVGKILRRELRES